jgi:hypothetical protein
MHGTELPDRFSVPLNYMIQIPQDFDLAALQLDPNEVYARDSLAVAMEQWARFRHAVAMVRAKGVGRAKRVRPVEPMGSGLQYSNF